MKGYHDIAGDGGSNVVEQVEELRARIAENLAGVRHLVAVGSGKGGVGKSTLTIRLASVLRASGREVAVLDADFNGPSQAHLSGIGETPLLPRDGKAALPRTRDGIGVFSMGSLFPAGHAVDFDSVAPGSSHSWRAIKEFAVLGEVLASADWGKLDFLLVDLPPSAERTVQYAEYLGGACAFVLVTIPSDLSREVVARSVSALRGTPNRILGTIENMSGYYCADCDAVKPLFDSAGEDDLGVPCLGRVPFDPALASGTSTRALDGVSGAIVEALEGRA